MEEIWKDIPGFEGEYEVSNCGRVKTKSRPLRYVHAVTREEHVRISEERLLLIYINGANYKFVQLYKNKKSKNYTIHSLVAMTFLEKKEGDECVNHIDGNKHNNRVDNLEWCTNAYNHEHATRTGLKPSGSRMANAVLNEKAVLAIRSMIEDGISHTKISKWFDVSRATISLIHEGKTWKRAI